jgi:hypothetical protein
MTGASKVFIVDKRLSYCEQPVTVAGEVFWLDES